MRTGFLCALMLFGMVLASEPFATYDQAKWYHCHSAQQTEVAMALLGKHTFSGGERILHLNSRTGRISAYLAMRFPETEVVGIEKNRGMYSFAKRNHPKRLFPNLSFEFVDFSEKKFEGNFDCVVSTSSLHWYENQMEVLKFAYNALKKGGRVIFSVPCRPMPGMLAAFEDLLNQDPWKEYVKDYKSARAKYPAQEYEKLLKEAGFSECQVETVERTHLFMNKRDFIDWYKAFSPLLEYIPQNKRNKFLEDFAECYIKHIPLNVMGCISLTQKELFIHASK